MNSPEQWLTIGIQALAIIALAVCYLKYEKRFVAWENKQIKRLKKAIRRRLKKWLETTLPELEQTPDPYRPGPKGR